MTAPSAPPVRVPEARIQEMAAESESRGCEASMLRRTGVWLGAHPASVCLAVYVVLAVALFGNTWLRPTTTHVGVYGDPESYFWAMSWGPFAVSHLLNPFYTTYLAAPTGANLMWNATPPLPGLAIWPVTSALGPAFSYNLLITLGLAVSAWCMYLALRRMGLGQVGALVGGLTYGFSPYMTEHALGHIALNLAMVPPLMMLVLHEAFVRQQWRAWRTGVALGGLAAVQLLTFQEMLASELIAALVASGALMALNVNRVRGRAAHAVRCVVVGVGAFGVLTAPALRTLLLGPQRLGSGTVHPPNIYVNDLLSFVVPAATQEFAPRGAVDTTLAFTGISAEWNGYLGIPLLVLVAVSVIRLRRHATLVRVAAVTALVLAILSMGPHLHIRGHDTGIWMPASLLGDLPVLAHLIPSRLSLFMDLFVAVILAAFVQAAWDRRRWLLRYAGLAATGMALLALVPALPFPSTASAAPPEFFTTAAVRRVPEGSVALVAPYIIPSLDAEVWQVAAGFRFRMPDGYVFLPSPGGIVSGPPLTPLTAAMVNIGLGLPRPVLAPGLRAQLMTNLADMTATTVIVGPMPHGDEMVRLFEDLIGRPPESVGGVDVWWNVSARRVS